MSCTGATTSGVLVFRAPVVSTLRLRYSCWPMDLDRGSSPKLFRSLKGRACTELMLQAHRRPAAVIHWRRMQFRLFQECAFGKPNQRRLNGGTDINGEESRPLSLGRTAHHYGADEGRGRRTPVGCRTKVSGDPSYSRFEIQVLDVAWL